MKTMFDCWEVGKMYCWGAPISAALVGQLAAWTAPAACMKMHENTAKARDAYRAGPRANHTEDFCRNRAGDPEASLNWPSKIPRSIIDFLSPSRWVGQEKRGG